MKKKLYLSKMGLSSRIKKGLMAAGLYQLADSFAFRYQQWKYRRDNRLFLHEHKDLPLPLPYTLYESYRLNYRQYLLDGEETAKELLADTLPLISSMPMSVLDLGCGPVRILRHFSQLLPTGTTLTGVDSNAETIRWNQANFPHTHFLTCGQAPPVALAANSFQLVIAYSLFTHIPYQEQTLWLKEIHRLLAPNGIAYITTHGAHFDYQLSNIEKQQLQTTGGYTSRYPITGHRMMTTYNHAPHLRDSLSSMFTILHHYAGAQHPNKAGKQDCWIVQKKP